MFDFSRGHSVITRPERNDQEGEDLIDSNRPPIPESRTPALKPLNRISDATHSASLPRHCEPLRAPDSSNHPKCRDSNPTATRSSTPNRKTRSLVRHAPHYSLYRGSKSFFLIALIFTTRRRIPASSSKNQGTENGDLTPLGGLVARAPHHVAPLPASVLPSRS